MIPHILPITHGQPCLLIVVNGWQHQARRFGDVAEFRHLHGLRGVYRGVVPRWQGTCSGLVKGLKIHHLTQQAKW